MENVEGLGNKAIKVTFSEPVKINSTVAGTFKLDDKVVSGILSGNGTRTVIIELFTTQTTGKHTLSINNQVEDFAGYDLVATSKEFDVVEDVTAPTVIEVKDVTLESATVVFSEDVKDAEAVKGSNYYWMNGTTKHAADASVEKIDGKTFKLTFSGDHKLPAVATDLYITNIVDYSGNKIAADTKVSVNPVIDQTRPEVVSAIFADTNDSLTLTFNKNVNPASFKSTNVVLKDKDGKVVTGYGFTISESSSSSRTLTVNFSDELEAGTYTFELTGIQDTTTLKNTALPIVETLTVDDVSKPTATSVTGEDNVYYVSFDAAMDISTEASVLNPENYYVKYVQSGVTKVGKLPASTNLTPVNGNKGVLITLPSSVSDLLEITIQGVKGANGSFLDGFSKKFEVGGVNPITNSFDVVRVNATASDKLLVKFNQPVSSVDVSAFTLTGAAGVVTNYEIQSDNTLVELTLSGDLDADAVETLNFTDAAAKNLTNGKVTVPGSPLDIKDSIASSVVKTGDKIVVANSTDAAGVIAAASIVVDKTPGSEKVTIKFDEEITAKNVSNLRDNFKLYQANGLALEYGADYEVASASINALTTSATPAGTDTVVLDLSNSSYDGALNIQLDNSNANLVDVTAEKLNGTPNTALAVKGFDTRTSGSTVGTINTGVAPTFTAAASQTNAAKTLLATTKEFDIDLADDLAGALGNNVAVEIVAADLGVGVGKVPTASYAAGKLTITINSNADGATAAVQTIANIESAVEALQVGGDAGDFVVTTTNGATALTAADTVSAVNFAGGSDVVVVDFDEAVKASTIDTANANTDFAITIGGVPVVFTATSAISPSDIVTLTVTKSDKLIEGANINAKAGAITDASGNVVASTSVLIN